MAFFVDTFTEASDTLLSSHTPDTGTSWTKLWADPATVDVVAIASSDRAQPESASSSGSTYTADATYSSADYYIEITLVAVGTASTRSAYLFVRVQDVDNLYAVRLRSGAGNSQLYKKVTGTWSTVGSTFTLPAAGSVVKLEIVGTQLTFYDDGVSVATGVVSDHAAAGKAGLGFGGGAELVASTDNHSSEWELDDMTVDVATAAETFIPRVYIL